MSDRDTLSCLLVSRKMGEMWIGKRKSGNVYKYTQWKIQLRAQKQYRDTNLKSHNNINWIQFISIWQ